MNTELYERPSMHIIEVKAGRMFLVVGSPQNGENENVGGYEEI